MEPSFCNWYNRNQNDPDTPEQLLESILTEAETIAMVGLSRNPYKDSHYVGRYLQLAGYRIVPVNPGAEKILGEISWPDLGSIPFQVDVVNISRKPDDVPDTVEEALQIRPKVIWLQLGTGKHPELKSRAETEGIVFIQNRCMKVDHQFLIRPKKPKSAPVD